MEENKEQEALVQEEVKPKYNRDDFPYLWEDVQPHAVVGMFGEKTYMSGSKSLSKMIQFKIKVGMTNEDVDYWMKQPVTDKTVGNFQKNLLKHRYRIYEYPEFSTKQLKRKQRNESRSN